MQKDEFILLAKKYAQNKCSLEEERAVEEIFRKLQDSGQVIPYDFTEEKRNFLLKRIHSKIDKPKNSLFHLYSRTLKIAATVIVLLGISFLIAESTSKNLITQSAAKGEMKTLFLPDGSQLILNANSSITYSSDFKENRSLNLKGEAYFKVVKNPKSPFTVETAQFKTKVLGTSFTIRAYKNYLNKISVLSGRVEVSSKEKPTYKVFLTKNQQLSFPKSQSPLLSNNSHEDFLAWTKNIVILHNTTLGETAEILRNKFNVTILFDNPELEKLRISGKFKNEDITTILKTIAEVKQLKIDFQTQNKIFIRGKPKK